MKKFKKIFPKKNITNKIHFIGIGGFGMASIAKVLAQNNYKISGSDIVSNIKTDQLIKLGVNIYFKHDEKNLINVSLVVKSNAIANDNVELITAKKLNIPIISRLEMLSELMRFYYSIAIAGTHGKTTTTAMISNIYNKAGMSPTVINGGLTINKNIYSNLGYSKYIIVEVDESDASFLLLRPIVSIITNIEHEHIRAYKNFNNLKNTFIKFINNLPFYGYAIVCIDDFTINEFKSSLKRKIITYGFSKHADLRIVNYLQYGMSCSFNVVYNKINFSIKLNIPGKHNALNATAAMALALEEKIDNKIILKSLSEFKGINRRFNNLGYFNLTNINGKIGKIMLIDDYGHHPTEINYTISTIRQSWPNKRLIMLFQPHRFTRIKDLYNEFIKVLSNVDILIILEICPAWEKPILNVNSFSLYSSINKIINGKSIFLSKHFSLKATLAKLLKDNDLILIQSVNQINNLF